VWEFCLICCFWHGMNNQSNILFSFLLFHCMDLMWLCHILLLAPLNLQITRHHPLCPPTTTPPHVGNKFITYGLFVFNFWKMFYAFLIATDTTIKTKRKALSLPTKRFYVTPNKHQSFELDASAINCRDQSTTTTQEENKRWVLPRLWNWMWWVSISKTCMTWI
jgi:hypothetical protein